jgi:F1F0 ATPase subunit 2
MPIDLSTLTRELLSLPLGFALGLFYFTCLWFTVRQLPRTRHPVLLMLGLAIAALVWMVQGHWERLLIALLGFLLARGLLIARWGIQASLEDVLAEA